MIEFNIIPSTKSYEALYKLAVSLGSRFAAFRLSFLKQHGRPDIVMDREESNYYASKFDSNGLIWIKTLAEHGFAPAQSCLAIAYHTGMGVDENHELAYTLCLKAARQECAQAMNMLGNFPLSGIGTEKNPRFAFIWYVRATQVNEVASFYNIGTLFEQG